MRIEGKPVHRNTVLYQPGEPRGNDGGVLTFQLSEHSGWGKGGSSLDEGVLSYHPSFSEQSRPFGEYQGVRDPVLRFEVARN